MAGAAVQTVVTLETLAPESSDAANCHFSHDNMKALNSGRCTVLRRVGGWRSLLLSSVPYRVTRISSRLPCLLTKYVSAEEVGSRPSASAFRPTGELSARPVAACLLNYVFVCILDAQNSLCVEYGVPDYFVTWSRSVVAYDLNACLMHDKSCV